MNHKVREARIKRASSDSKAFIWISCEKEAERNKFFNEHVAEFYFYGAISNQ